MNQVYNFSAGPAVLPQSVLAEAQSEFLNYKHTGMSVMEMSHRGDTFLEILADAEQSLRKLMNIPEEYSVLFLQGGASMQFAMAPLNLMNHNNKADYVETGMWAKKAAAEAKKYGSVRIVASSADKLYTYIPAITEADVDPAADYFYITLNNTIYGTRYPTLPQTGSVPLVGDASSCILGETIDISRFGLLFAGAQKNIGPAGLTIAIIKKELIDHPMEITPTMLQYATHAKNDSLYNTPPTYGIYIAGKVFHWIADQGGVAAMEQKNKQKSGLLYDYLDHSRHFMGTVEKAFRSYTNIPFVLPTEEMNHRFLQLAEQQGLYNLKGHRSVGGMRASLYNAMPLEGVEALLHCMEEFEKTI